MKGDKMVECNMCGKDEGVHRWGRYTICGVCHERMTKIAQSKDENVKIKLPKETRLGIFGWYENGDGEICLCNGNRIEQTINHEFMHHILNTRISPQTSYQYDNIGRKHIDSYHSFE